VLRFFIFGLITCSSLFSIAQVRVSAGKPVRLEYKSKFWNKNPNEIDHPAVLLRDGQSKKMVRIQLEETAPNSGVFWGSYSVTFGEQDLVPEVYFPPQNLLNNPDQMKTIEAMIKDGSLIRKPYFIRDDGKGLHILTIFDSKEQAIQALEDYRKLRSITKSPVGEAAMLAQAQAAKEKALQEALAKAAQGADARSKVELVEKMKKEALMKDFEALSAAEKAKRQAQASQLVKRAMDAYGKGNYKDSAADFEKAAEVDPTNTKFYFQYGISLYQIKNYNKAFAILHMTKDSEVNVAEKAFYIGSIHMELKENESAIKDYEIAKNKKDPKYSGLAAFYAALLHYQMENYDQAKENFEFVIDNSSDPKLDSQSETYIEQIANVLAFKKEQSKKFILSANLGLMYDSNILSIARSQLDQQTELAGYRWMYGGSIEYRPLYTATQDFSVLLAASDMYSMNNKFSAEKTFQNTDPLSASLYFPYHYKGKAFDKGYQMTLSPGFEKMWMNADTIDGREIITDSVVLKNDHTFVMNNTWFSTYSLELRSDTSHIEAALGTDDDSTATKVTLGTTQTFFQNDKKTEAWIGEFGVSQNNAKGANSTYNRADFAATYMSPWKWDTIWTARLGFYYADYNKHVVGRKDTDSSLTLGLTKPLSEILSANLSGTYTNNASTLDSSDYNKYVIMTTFSWTTSL
jgi:tetratricopeptide (TPR) repeat protein